MHHRCRYRQPRSRLGPPHPLAPEAHADEHKPDELRSFYPLSLHRFEIPYPHPLLSISHTHLSLSARYRLFAPQSIPFPERHWHQR